jgi:hypothetical protein
MRLARARAADKNQVVRALGERHAGQLRDELAIDRRAIELEAGDVAMHRELRRVHLVADRTHGPIRDLGLQQRTRAVGIDTVCRARRR